MRCRKQVRRIEQGKGEQAVEQARKAALRLLRYRARSENELLMRLQQKGWSATVAKTVVRRLKRVGLVNDQELAEAVVQSALADTKPHARFEVRYKLRTLGISDKLADEAISVWTEEIEREMARHYLQKHLPNPNRASQAEIARAYRAAVQKGFSFDALRDALRTLDVHWDSNC